MGTGRGKKKMPNVKGETNARVFLVGGGAQAKTWGKESKGYFKQELGKHRKTGSRDRKQWDDRGSTTGTT